MLADALVGAGFIPMKLRECLYLHLEGRCRGTQIPFLHLSTFSKCAGYLLYWSEEITQGFFLMCLEILRHCLVRSVKQLAGLGWAARRRKGENLSTS